MDRTTKLGRLLVLGDGGPAGLEALSEALAGQFEIVRARTLEEALDQLRKGEFAAVLSGTGDFLPLERAAVSQQSAAVLDALGQAMSIVDGEGRVLWENRAFGSLGEEVIEQVRSAAKRALGQFRIGELGPPGSAGRVRRFGAQSADRFFEVVVSPMIAGGPDAGPAPDRPVNQVTVVVNDVTASRRLQRKLDAIDHAGRELVRLEAESVAKLDVQQRLQLLEERIIRATRDLLHFENFGVWLLDRASGRLQLVLSDGFPEWVSELELHAANEGNGITGHVAATGRSYICADTSRDPRYITGIEGARSSLTVPLRMHDAIIGVLNVESRKAGDFTEDDRQFGEIFARYVAMSLNILDLLVVERYTTSGKFANNVAGEIDQPLNEIVSAAAALIEENVGHDALRGRLNAIIDTVTSIRQTVRQVAEAPTSILGRREIHHVRHDPTMAAKRVLVADDDAAILKDLCDLLGNNGCIVEQARDGAEATAMVRSRDYDLVLCDIRMPHATGYDIFSAVRTRSPETPVILMTGFGYDPHHSIFKARQEGVFAVLFKPFKVEQVLDKCRQALMPKP